MRKTDLAKLVVRMEAELGKYSRELTKARSDTQKWRKAAKSDIASVKNAFKALVGFLAVKKAASFYKEHADGLDRLAKQANKLGMTTEALQSMRYAGELTGVSINTMDMALQRQTRRIAEAAKGYGEAQGALKELNLDAKQLVQLPVDKQFEQIAVAMQKVERDSDRVRLAMKLFDSEGVALVNTLALGKDGLREASAELEQFGAVVSLVDAAKVEAANDSFRRTSKVLGAVGDRMAIETAPILNGITSQFLNAARESGGLGNVTRQAVDIIVTGVGWAANVVHGLKVAWMGVRQVVAEHFLNLTEGFGSMAKLGNNMLSKIGMDSDTLAGISEFSESFKYTVESMREELSSAAMEKMPLESIREWIADIRVKSQAEAEAQVEKNGGLGRYLLGDTNISTELTKEQERADQIASIRQGWRKSELRKEMEFQAKIIDFQEASTKRKIKTALSEGVQLTQGAANTSKTLFRINQALALADAAVTLPSAVLKAVERGGGWPWGAAFGALTLANGLAQISAIKSASFGGGQSASLAGVGGGSTLVTDVTPPDLQQAANDGGSEERGTTHIYFQGNIYGLDDFQERVIETVADASDRNRLVIRDSSGRQTLEVA